VNDPRHVAGNPVACLFYPPVPAAEPKLSPRGADAGRRRTALSAGAEIPQQLRFLSMTTPANFLEIFSAPGCLRNRGKRPAKKKGQR